MINTLITGALLSAALSVAPSTSGDGWQAFAGCWRAESAPPGALLCVVPESNGARMLELQDGRITRETRVITDAQARPVSQQGCSGTESGRWSADGERVFLNTDMTCTGAIDRKASAVFAMVTRFQWISIQAVTVGTEGGTTTTRYGEVSDDAIPADILALFGDSRLARETARYAAVRALDLQDVGEAVRQVEPRAVEALLLAREQPFKLDARKLLALSDAGIPSYVIDAMVAVTHPDVFRVEELPVPSSVGMSDVDLMRQLHEVRDMRDLRYGSCNSYSYDPWMTAYDARCGRNAFAYGYNSGYSPWGGYPNSDYYNRPVIIVRGSEADRVSRGKATPSGYSNGDITGTKGAQPRDRSVSPSPSTSTVRTPTPSTGSSSGSTESSGSSGSGRTAKPRT